MFELLQLIVLFFVLFDPPASLAVFFVATEGMSAIERKKTALYAVLVAGLLSFGTLFFGEWLLKLFNTNINDFRIAGGIVLIILGIRMALGYPLFEFSRTKKQNSSYAIASLIATPLLTGPAVMTSTIIIRHDYGIFLTGLAISTVLLVTALIFYNSQKIYNLFGRITSVISTFLGLVIIAWGVNFLRTAFGF